jgi:signal transduction histidine kinase
MMKPEECREALRNILSGGRRLHRTLRNYIYAVDRLEPDSASPFPVLSAESVKQFVHQGVAAAADRHGRHADLEVEISGEPLAGGARELALLVEELTDNAFSFSQPHSPVRVHAGRVDAEFHIMVSDQGRGMTRRQLKELGLFRQFERRQYEQQGLGVGLFIVEQAVRRLGGRLQFESEKDAGTLCRVMLPVATDSATLHHG